MLTDKFGRLVFVVALSVALSLQSATAQSSCSTSLFTPLLLVAHSLFREPSGSCLPKASPLAGSAVISLSSFNTSEDDYPQIIGCMFSSRAKSGGQPPPSDNPSGNEQGNTHSSDLSPSFSRLPFDGGGGGDKKPDKGSDPPEGDADEEEDIDPEDQCPYCLGSLKKGKVRVLKCCGKKIHAECVQGWRIPGRCQCTKSFKMKFICRLCPAHKDNDLKGTDDLDDHFCEHLDQLEGYIYPYFCPFCSDPHLGSGTRQDIRSCLSQRLAVLCLVPECPFLGLSHQAYTEHYQDSHSGLLNCPVASCDQPASAEHMVNQHGYCKVSIPTGENSMDMHGSFDQIMDSFMSDFTHSLHCVLCMNPWSVRLIGGRAVSTPMDSVEDLMGHFVQIHCRILCSFCLHTDSPLNQDLMSDHMDCHDICLEEQASPPAASLPGTDEAGTSDKEEEDGDLIVCPICGVRLPDDRVCCLTNV